jgi:bifunctional N-acetylglucosamine-1-phosphate-uridyltransferase/glucosamine-1-phosphate-acetyltransferase GlmU-like protein
MLDHLLDLYAAFVEGVAVIVHPAALDQVRQHVIASARPTEIFLQDQPTGMLDAILLARPAVEHVRAERVWITWCDQVAIHPQTVARLAREDAASTAPPVILPTCRRADPYVHLERDATGRIVRVLHRREGDAMPESGESDAGLFDLSRRAFLEWLPEFGRQVQPASGTRERNFLPFVAWAAARAPVVTFPCTEPEETIGVNTPAELALVEAHLRARASTA